MRIAALHAAKRCRISRLLALTLLFLPLTVTREAAAQSASPQQPSHIEAAVRHRLTTRLPDNHRNIDVTVDGAAVVLTGVVDLLSKRQIAADAAGAVPGVTRVTNQVTVTPEERPDEIVAVEARAAIEAESATAGQKVDVSAEDGVVTLRGLVDSVAQKRVAGWLASNQRGVREVRNQIRVAPASRPDPQLHRDLVQRFAGDPVFANNAISVAVTEGAVVLTGSVDSLWEKQRAEDAAWVSGVRYVDGSNLEVRTTAPTGRDTPRPPAQILADIRAAAASNAALANNQIEPEIQDGRVTLSGHVDTYHEKTVAEDLARHIPGVVGVTNRLEVKGLDFAERAEHHHAALAAKAAPVTITPGQPAQEADAKLKAAIEHALANDPWTRGQRIEVSVQHGVVTLRGTAGTSAQQTAAVAIAREAGARVVKQEFNTAAPR